MFKKFICSALIIIALLSVSVSAIELPDYDLGLPEGYEWFEFISGEKQKQFMLSGATQSLPSIAYSYEDGSTDFVSGPYLDSNYNYPVVHYNKGLTVGKYLKTVTLSMFTVSNRFSYVDKLFVDFYVAGMDYNQTASLVMKQSNGTNKTVALSQNGNPAEAYDEYGNFYVVYRFTGMIDIDAASDDYLFYLRVIPYNHGTAVLVDEDTINTDAYWVQFNTIYYTPRAGYNGNVIQIIQSQQDILNGINQASDDIQSSIDSSADRIDQSIQDASDEIQNSIESGVNDIINMPGVEFVEPEGADSEEYVLSEFDQIISGFSQTDLSWMDVSIARNLATGLEFVGSKILVPIFSSTPLKTLFQCILPIMLFLLAIGALSGIRGLHDSSGSSRSNRGTIYVDYVDKTPRRNSGYLPSGRSDHYLR